MAAKKKTARKTGKTGKKTAKRAKSRSAKARSAKKATTKKKARSAKKATTKKKAGPRKATTKKKAGPRKATAKKKAGPRKAAARKKAGAGKGAKKKARPEKSTTKKKPARKTVTRTAKPAGGPRTRAAGGRKALAGVAATVQFVDEGKEVARATTQKKKLPKKITKEFLDILEGKRQRILGKARSTIEEGMKFDEADLPDEYDQATSEYLQYFTLRLRGREKYFLDKIEQAIARIKDGSFGYCEACGVQIGMNRLRARPETTLCIRCKEAQEREERQFGE